MACALTGRCRATHYRRGGLTRSGRQCWDRCTGPGCRGVCRPRRSPATNEPKVLALLNSEPYRDLAIPQVWARELDEGRYWCSESSMYGLPRYRAEPGTAGPGQSSGPGSSRAGRARPQRGVELGYHRAERTTQRPMVQTVRRARSSPDMSLGGSSPTPRTRSWPRISSLIRWPVTSLSRTQSTPTEAAR